MGDLVAWLEPARAPSRREQGFTLIEMLVVVIIIGILASIAIPVYLNQEARAADATIQADLKHLSAAAESWWVDHTQYPVDTAGWTAVQPLSAGVTVQAFTSNTVPAGYVIYGSSSMAQTHIWELSSWAGGVPTKTALTVLPDVAPTAGQLNVPTGTNWQSWAMIGGASWGVGATTPDVLAWFDPGLEVSSKIGATTAAVGGWDGHLASDGTDSAWSIVPVSDAPVAGRAAQVITGDPSHEWGIQASPWTPGVTPPADAFLASGQTYTLSVWVKANAGTPFVMTGRVEHASTWVWIATAVNKPFTATGSWQRVTATIVATSAWATGDSYVAITVRSLANTGVPAGKVLQVTAPQVDRGPVATPWQRQ